MKRMIVFSVFVALLLMVPKVWAAQYQLRIQTAVPSASMYYKTMERLGDRIERLSGGEIKVEVFADGGIVHAFEILDAVNDGIVEGGQAWTHYWSGKHPAGLLFSAPTAGLGVGLDQNAVLAWAWEGEGHDLLNRYFQDILGLDIVGYLSMPMGPEPFGWFKEEFNSVEDLKSVKFRSPPGIPSESFRLIGMPVVSMPGGEIVPSAQRGVIDAAEWISPGDDRLLGLADVWKYYYLEGLHQAISIGDVYINKTWYEKLPPRLQAVIDESMRAMIGDQVVMNVDINSFALNELATKHGTQLRTTPDDYVEAYMAAVGEIVDKYAEKDAFFKEVLDSLLKYAEVAVPYQTRVNRVYYTLGQTALDTGATKDYE
jgi:TRAP-type mannitol/chloroaromatic compound transport system substrate-binding protein